MTAALEIAVTRLAHARDLELPAYATPGAAGLDLLAASGPTALSPGDRALIPCGIALALPVGYEGQVRARSGLALTHGITVLNSPGTIDSDYRGEIGVILVNLGERRFLVRRGMRIAQLVIAPVARAHLIEAPDLPASLRGGGGFGSTGVGGSTGRGGLARSEP